MHTNKSKLSSLALGLCVLVGATACDDDSTVAPESGAEAGRVSRAGSGGNGNTGGKADAGSPDAGEAEAGSGGSRGRESSDDACFDGVPEETKQFLNRCTDSECEPFDNAKRLPLLEDGELPALP